MKQTAELGFIPSIERASHRVAAEVIDTVRAIQAAIGPRPAGYERISRQEQLADYVTWRSDPMVWQQRIDGWSTPEDKSSGYAIALRVATELESALLRAGEWDGTPDDVRRATEFGVRSVQLRRALVALRRARKPTREIEKLEGKQPVVVTPDLAPPSVLGLIVNEGGA